MLRIKDNVDLKELEKFGYFDMGNCYQRYDNWGVQFFVDKKTREITRIHPYSMRTIPINEEIENLIQAGLVEKVGG